MLNQIKIEKLNREALFRFAFILAIITVSYNLLEGLIATYFGYQDETLALFGFGLDSFIEVLSGIGILHMIMRIQQSPESQRDMFEIRALKITGWSFYILCLGLSATTILNVLTGHRPTTTFWGIIISTLSILTMYVLMRSKILVGKSLDSQPILSDANCTKACLYMSILLLFASTVYELTGIAHIDTIGTLGIIYFSYQEGKECFEKAQNKKTCCSCG